MEYAKGEGIEWRAELGEWLTRQLRHRVFNPNAESVKYFRRKSHTVDFRQLKFQNLDLFSKVVRGIVDFDSREIAHRSDYVICLWDRSAQRGAGTKGELTIARFFRKPVYVVTRTKHENIPGWILGCSTRFFTSFDELKSFLLERYGHSQPLKDNLKGRKPWKAR